MEESRIERFTRIYGKAFKTDKNGTMYFADHKCHRCGGVGFIDCFKYVDGGVCFECGGSGISPKPEVIKLYTPEYEAKLEARRKAKQAKKEAEHEAQIAEIRQNWLLEHGFTADGFTFMFLGNTFDMKDAIKEAGGKFNQFLGWHIDHEVEGFHFLKVSIKECGEESYWGYEITKDMKEARTEASKKFINEPESVWFGQEGDKVDMIVKYRRTSSFTIPSYSRTWLTESMHIHTFTDDAGHTFCWKTGNFPEMEVGQEVHLKGTVKNLTEYKGIKQTNLTRCKVTS